MSAKGRTISFSPDGGGPITLWASPVLGVPRRAQRPLPLRLGEEAQEVLPRAPSGIGKTTDLSEGSPGAPSFGYLAAVRATAKAQGDRLKFLDAQR